MTEYVLECRECGSYDPKTDRVTGIKKNRLNFKNSAEALAKIHRIKTGHDPVIKEVGGDE